MSEDKSNQDSSLSEWWRYRVMFVGFKKYEPYDGEMVTNVHTVLECDVIAKTSQEAIRYATVAFKLTDSKRGGEWTVEMRGSVTSHKYAVGSSRNASTIVALVHGR